MHNFKLIVITLIALLLAGLLVSLGEDYQLQVDKLVAGYDRMNIDLSLDGGQTYPANFACGIPVNYGTNTYTLSLPNDPTLLTDAARMRFQTLSDRGATNGLGTSCSENTFVIAGVYINTPEGGEEYTDTIPIIWTSNEAGDQVLIGISTNNGASYTLAAYADNIDGINDYILTIPDGMTGKVKLTVVSITDHKCHGESKEFLIK